MPASPKETAHDHTTSELTSKHTAQVGISIFTLVLCSGLAIIDSICCPTELLTVWCFPEVFVICLLGLFVYVCLGPCLLLVLSPKSAHLANELLDIVCSSDQA